MYKYLLILLLISWPAKALPQSSDIRQKASYKLSKQLEEGSSDEKLALSYEAAAKEQSTLGEYAKAEDYLNKAKQLYQKLKNKEKIAQVERELAKIQESQNKFDEAISNYNSASQLSTDKLQQSLNANDMRRVMNNSNPQVQKELINENIELLKNTSNRKEKANAYQQMADVNLQLENKNEAIENLNTALKDIRDPVDAVKINRQIAEIYVENKDFKKAADINEKLLEKAKKTNDSRLEVEQLQALSSVYIEGQEKEKGINTLQQAYDLALKDSHTLEAKKSLELLIEQYKKDNNNKQHIIDLYSGFMDKLETLIKSDSSLVDSKLYQINEDRISQLEKEKILKDELIKRTNNLNYVLIGSVAIAIILILLIAKSLYANKKKNKKIALQSLRREMNPHFIFNSLNSVNQFIAQNNELEANKYLSSYSKLMRNIMENSNKDFIPLSTEIEQMKEYLELEYMRFHDKFVYQINIDPNLDTDLILVPNMLIQPQLENAIWHGLRYKEVKGALEMDIRKDGNNLIIKIEDNGIGLKKSEELKTRHQKIHQSRGLTNTKERIFLLNNLYNSKINIDIKDKSGTESGVIVTITFPVRSK